MSNSAIKINPVLSNKTTAVYGDPQTVESTVVPTLAKASDSSNLQVVSDKEQFNLFQVLTLNDNFYDTKTEDVYQSQSQSNTVSQNIVIQGNLMGWTHMKQIVLAMQFRMNVNAKPTTGSTNLSFGNNQLFPLCQWMQPDFTFLNSLRRLRIMLGENNQLTVNEGMIYVPYLKMVIIDQKYTVEEKMMLAQLGVPGAIGFYNSQSTNGLPYVPDGTLDSVGYEWQNRYNNWKELSCLNLQNGYIDRLEIGVPLFFLNSFFNQDAYLPPETKFYIEIEINNPTLDHVMMSNSVAMNLGTPTSNPNLIFGNFTNNGLWRLAYRQHTLKAHVQDEINREWISKPMLYNYNDYEYYQLTGDGTTTNFTADIAINQQRPTELSFVIYNNLGFPSSSVPGTQFTSSANGNVQFPVPVVTFANSISPGWRITPIRIFIAGKEQYLIRNENPTYNNGANTIYFSAPIGVDNVLNDIVNQNVDNDFERTQTLIYSKTNNVYFAQPYKININPGDFQKMGYMSTDNGAMVIRVAFSVQAVTQNTYNFPLPNGFKVVIYKKLPRQAQINAAKNFTTIQWPAVVGGNGYLIPSTYNMN